MVLLTGASGFIGNAVCQFLESRRPLRVAVRDREATALQGHVDIVEACLDASQDWSFALTGVSVVIHCAARVHVMNSSERDALAEFRRVNVEGTLALARQAAAANVRRFVFLSSIKVNGEGTVLGAPFSADQTPAPVDAYGVSKQEAEEGLRALSKETGIEIVCIRPPLVYGPGAKANFQAVMRWVWRRVPLPFGNIQNKRSFVALGNLVDLIVTCIDHPAAANETFLVSDGQDLSTTELLRRVGEALGKPALLIPIPAWVVTDLAKMVGKPELARRLCGSLQVDTLKTRRLLGWTPPLSVDDGLQLAANYWISLHNISHD